METELRDAWPAQYSDSVAIGAIANVADAYLKRRFLILAVQKPCRIAAFLHMG
jgi:hypothetical protein